MFQFINKYLFAPILSFLTDLTGGSYAAGIFLFTLVINLLLVPLSIKSQKASVNQIKIKPKMDEIKRKYGDDKQKMQVAMQKLYSEERISMGGGCLPMIIRMILVLSVFYLVRSPLTYLTDLSSAEIGEMLGGDKSAYKELHLLAKGGSEALTAATKDLNFYLFGIDLTDIVTFSLDLSTLSWNWIIPFLAFGGAMFSSIISLVQQKKLNPDAPSMKTMMLLMPLMSLFISFAAPAALGFYWACSSFIGAIIQAGVQQYYGPYRLIANEQAKAILTAAGNEKKNSGSSKK